MKILGNKKIIDSLERAIAEKSLAQSYLFCGLEALGKFLVANEFAKKLTGWQGETVNQNLLLIEPDIEEKDGIFKEKEIKLEKIKHLQKEFGLTAFFENYRVAIIRNAERLNLSAQNALLKILEEPSPKSIIILVAEDEKKLLPTIVSRCQIKRFKLLTKKELSEKLGQDFPNKEELLFWSLGRPGFLENFLHEKTNLEERREIIKELQNLFSIDGNEKLALAENLSKNMPVLLEKMDLWIVLLRSVILGQRKLGAVSPTKALKLIEKIEESKKIIKNTNASVRLVAENLLLAF